MLPWYRLPASGHVHRISTATKYPRPQQRVSHVSGSSLQDFSIFLEHDLCLVLQMQYTLIVLNNVTVADPATIGDSLPALCDGVW